MDTRKYKDDKDERHTAKRITRHPIVQEMRENARRAEAALVAKNKALEARALQAEANAVLLEKQVGELKDKITALTPAQEVAAP